MGKIMYDCSVVSALQQKPVLILLLMQNCVLKLKITAERREKGKCGFWNLQVTCYKAVCYSSEVAGIHKFPEILLSLQNVNSPNGTIKQIHAEVWSVTLP
jgi:hypothetical protein